MWVDARLANGMWAHPTHVRTGSGRVGLLHCSKVFKSEGAAGRTRMPVSTRRRARAAPQPEGTQSETRVERPPAKRVKRAGTQAQHLRGSQSATRIGLATWADAGAMQLRDGEGEREGEGHTLLGAVMDHLNWDREESSAVRQVLPLSHGDRRACMDARGVESYVVL